MFKIKTYDACKILVDYDDWKNDVILGQKGFRQCDATCINVTLSSRD